jgi:hypothetical protein
MGGDLVWSSTPVRRVAVRIPIVYPWVYMGSNRLIRMGGLYVYPIIGDW